MNKSPKIENLTSYKKGQCGNPKGRPPVLPELKEVIAKIMSEEQKGMTALEAVLRSLLIRAVKGDTRAASELLDRYYGKSTQPVDHTTGGEKMNTFKIEVTNKETAAKLDNWLNENN